MEVLLGERALAACSRTSKEHRLGAQQRTWHRLHNPLQVEFRVLLLMLLLVFLLLLLKYY